MNTKTCLECDGKGIVDEGTDDERQCPNCGGSGVVLDGDDDGNVLYTKSNGPSAFQGGTLYTTGAFLPHPFSNSLRRAIRS